MAGQCGLHKSLFEEIDLDRLFHYCEYKLYPKAFYSTIKFSDWDEAMKRLEDREEKNG